MRVFVVGAKNYSDKDFRETMLYREGDSFMVEWPNRIYVTLLSN